MEIFKLMSESVEDKLLAQLRKDYPNLTDNEINKYIYNRTRNINMDFNKSYTLHINRVKCPVEEILDNLYSMDKRTNEWKRKLIHRYGKDNMCNYFIMIEYLKVFKNKTDINNVNMDTETLFKETYKQVFQPHHTKENASAWKQKKCRLKKKMLSTNPDITDYEYIMFNQLQQIIKSQLIN